MVTSIVLVALGLGAGWAIYGRKLREKSTAADPLANRAPGVIAFLGARMKFDELYAATFGRLNAALATFADVLDRFVWDGVIRFLSRLGEFAGVVNRETDEELLNGGFDAASDGLRNRGKAYSRAQSGDAPRLPADDRVWFRGAGVCGDAGRWMVSARRKAPPVARRVSGGTDRSESYRPSLRSCAGLEKS